MCEDAILAPSFQKLSGIHDNFSYQERGVIRKGGRNARKHGKTAVIIPDKKAEKPPIEK